MAAVKLPKKILARQHEIVNDFLLHIDRHLADLLSGKTETMHEIRDFAGLQHIHPTHLSNTIKLTTGKAPCYFFEERIMKIARQQLVETNKPVAEIAALLTFDPSNFTKFFKRFEGTTPKQFREAAFASRLQEAETVTI